MPCAASERVRRPKSRIKWLECQRCHFGTMSSLLERMEDFFASPKFTTAVGQFVATNADNVEFIPLDEEQPIGNYAVFKEYTAEIESLLEGFLESESSTPEELVDACREANVAGEGAGYSCVDYLLASAEYEHFMNMMYDFAAMQHGWEDGEEEKEAAGGLQAALGESKVGK